jgi:hypothetical protein
VARVYTTDFGDAPLGSPPPGWTVRWAAWPDVEVVEDATATNGRAVKFTAGGSSVSGPWRALTWDLIDNDPGRANAEILALVKSTGTVFSTGAQTYFGPCARLGSADNQSVAATLYTGSGTGGVQIIRRSGSTDQRTTSTVSAVRWEPGEWWWIRMFSVDDDRFFAKLWKRGDAEPAAWSVERTDSVAAVSGLVGVLCFNPGTYWLDRITVVTEPEQRRGWTVGAVGRR